MSTVFQSAVEAAVTAHEVWRGEWRLSNSGMTEDDARIEAMAVGIIAFQKHMASHVRDAATKVNATARFAELESAIGNPGLAVGREREARDAIRSLLALVGAQDGE